jgi:hypothetical protein
MFESCIILIIFENLIDDSGEYIIDKINPVINWDDKVIPRRNPIFQSREIEEGEGRSIMDDDIAFNRGFILIS